MTEIELEQAIVDYLIKEIDTPGVSIVTGSANPVATYPVVSDKGVIIVAYSGDPRYPNIPPAPRKESGRYQNLQYQEVKSITISMAYPNLRGPGASLYALLATVREKLTNLEIGDEFYPFVPISVKGPIESENTWWFQMFFETSKILTIAIHS